MEGQQRPDIPDHELVRPIGRGAYGEVWLARNVMGVWRAIKVVRRGHADAGKAFRREFEGIRRYEPHSRAGVGLVPILQVGSIEPGFYYVMELGDPTPETAEPGTPIRPDEYRPRTLAGDLARLGRLPLDECLEMAATLGAALAELHAHGLVHRDIKPSNVIYLGGRARLADPGLVSATGEAGTLVGTPGYLPPEGPGTIPGDLYGLGRTLYVAATGFESARFPETPREWIESASSALALEFHEIVLRLGDPRREARYGNANALLADVAVLRAGRSLRRARALERRVRTAMVIGGFAALAVLGMATVSWRKARDAERERRIAGRLAVAEADARAALVDARISEAQSLRIAGGFGARAAAWSRLREAAVSGAGAHAPSKLRREAAGLLAMPDIRFVPVDLAHLHRDPLLSAIHPDGQWVATLQGDGSLECRNREGLLRGRLPQPGAFPDAVEALSPDGDWVIVRAGGRFRAGDFRTGRWSPWQAGIAFGKTGSQQVAVDLHGAVSRIDAESPGRPFACGHLGEPPAASAPVTLSSVAAEGWIAAGWKRGGRIHVMNDAQPGVSTVVDLRGALSVVALSDDAATLAAGLDDGRVLIWRLPDTEPRWELPVATTAIRCLALSVDGRWLGLATEDEEIVALDAAAGSVAARGRGIAWRLDFDTAGHSFGWMRLGGRWGRMAIEPSGAVRRVRTHAGTAADRPLAFSPDGRLLAVGDGAMIRIRRFPDLAEMASFPAATARWLAFGDDPALLFQLDDQGFSAVELAPHPGEGRRDVAPAVASQGCCRAVALDAAREGFLALDHEGRLRRWSRETREGPQIGAHDSARFLAMPPAGRSAATGAWGEDGVKVWGGDDGRQPRWVGAKGCPIPAWSRDGRRLLVTGASWEIWDAVEWRRIHAGDPALSNVVGVPGIFAPDDSWFGVVEGDSDMVLRRSGDTDPWLTLSAPGGPRVLSMAISPDGRWVASTTVFGDVLAWDLMAMEAQLRDAGFLEIQPRGPGK